MIRRSQEGHDARGADRELARIRAAGDRQLTGLLAVPVVTAVWFSFTEMVEAVAPAPPLGPVISGGAARAVTNIC